MVDLERARLRKMMFTDGQKSATKALLRFNAEHGQSDFWLEKISCCLVALERRNTSEVISTLESLSRGGMGSFLDWVPEPYSGEDAEYFRTVWTALHGHWLQMLKPFKEYGVRYNDADEAVEAG